jgi:hypothetical protein
MEPLHRKLDLLVTTWWLQVVVQVVQPTLALPTMVVAVARVVFVRQ